MKLFLLLTLVALSSATPRRNRGGDRSEEEDGQSGRFFGFGRGRGRSGGRGGGIIGNVFRGIFGGGLDWFEVAEDATEDACLDVPDVLDSDGQGEAGQGGGDDAEGEGEGAERFVSLDSVTVCAEDSVGASKCICARKQRLSFGRSNANGAFRLKCGSCQNRFIPDDGIASGNIRSNIVRIDEEEEEESEEDFFQ